MPDNLIRFSVKAHAAWAPGAMTPSAWQDWLADPQPLAGPGEPAVGSMPAMQRRRAGLLGKMALEVAYQCRGDLADVPVVFCSRHGDVARSFSLLQAMAAGEPMSPAAFGMSVHNAIGGLFGIARGDRANVLALAGGQASAEHALIEACGLLTDGAAQVLVVMCDCPLPPLYSGFEDDTGEPYAWAWLIEAPGEQCYSLHWSAPAVPPAEALSPAGGLQVLRFHLAGEAHLHRATPQCHWHWMRHD